MKVASTVPVRRCSHTGTVALAAKNDDMALMSCLDAVTKEPCTVLCIASQADDGGIEFIPLGHFVPKGDPFDAYIPPET